MTRDQRIDALQRLINILQNNPEIPLPHLFESTNLLFCWNAEEWHKTVKCFGSGTKEADEDWLRFSPAAIPFLQILGNKSSLCERVVTGKKLIPETIIPAKPEEVIPAHEEEIVEWRCRPFTEEVA